MIDTSVGSSWPREAAAIGVVAKTLDRECVVRLVLGFLLPDGANCRAAHTGVNSPARLRRASIVASRRFVFTQSPGFRGINDDATTSHRWPRLVS